MQNHAETCRIFVSPGKANNKIGERNREMIFLLHPLDLIMGVHVTIEKKEDSRMRLIGKLKTAVEQAKDMDEAKTIIRNAGVELTDAEMSMVTGGNGNSHPQGCSNARNGRMFLKCKNCGKLNHYTGNINGCGSCGNKGADWCDVIVNGNVDTYDKVLY